MPQALSKPLMNDQLSLEDTADLVRLRRAWDGVLKRLGAEVPPAWLERFIKPLIPVCIESGMATLEVPGRFVMEWVKERYISTLEGLLSDEIGEPVTIELRLEPREKPGMALVSAPVMISPRQDETSFRPFERYTFETYVVGQSNRLAYAGAKAVAADPGVKYNPLFIYGASGLGKTHLLHGIAREILAINPKYPLVYVSAQQFAEEFVTALQNNRIDQFRRSQRNVNMWLVDDIQFIAGKDKTQEEVFHTFNHLQSLGKQIVLTSDRPPRDLYLMDERLRSRFEAGLVADIQMPDTETRCAIILSKAVQERIDLDHTVAMFLAENVPGNIRVLEGALTRLAAQASLLSASVNLELAQELVEKYYRSGVMAKPAFDQIVDAVSRHFKIPSHDIKGVSRKAPIVHARHVAVFVTREITKDSWKHIGSLFGDRDHTSMMHGYQKISEM
ncbi:MAG: chromosomal replication initiator protein, partial [Fimbriimonadaceae bacterium]|nr:chromosomal replication initiator protein [Fimbriimonadaceae bacterium]